ncbi:protein of unknown function [Paenibacillus alvei]|uniref:Uncharacterized protein n=1 Tax=Paenibacillus alvei TaxID=44250 RepID=A0A383RIQ9_PAEAL|nr:protein of unknown function [Paenibacillus alvei]
MSHTEIESEKYQLNKKQERSNGNQLGYDDAGNGYRGRQYSIPVPVHML